MADPTEAEREIMQDLDDRGAFSARVEAQREAEARLVEMREKAVAEIRRIRENYPQASTKQAVLALAERAVHTLPLPGAEHWEKLLEAARDVARHRPGWALPNALHEALAAFGEREGK